LREGIGIVNNDAREARRQYEEAVATGEIRWGMGVEPEERLNPVRAAYDAAQAGDRLFQTELTISQVQGKAFVGQSTTRIRRVETEASRIINEIEGYGWRLEHVSTTFVETGSSSSKRVLANVGSVEAAVHGVTTALYVFRRTATKTGS
jgi:hypothetical protein